MHKPNMPSKVALFDVGPSLEAICAKYGIQTPFNKHDVMVLNLYFATMFARVHVFRANPHPSVYDFSPLTERDLTIINDLTFDTYFTRTVKWQMMNKCIDFIEYVVTVQLSATTLIVEF